MKKLVINLVLPLVVIFLALISLMVVYQRGLMYHPTQKWTADPAQHHMQVVHYTTADNLVLAAWYAPPKDGKPVFVLFHGNAENLSSWVPVPDYFTKLGYGFLLAEYRGYGGNPGSPSENGFYNDGRAAMNWLIKEQKIPENKIVIYGVSIGSGTASQMALEYKNIKALVLEAPFTSAANEAGDIYPWLGPFKYLVFDRYDNISKALQFKMPVLIAHGSADALVPPAQSKALFNVLTGPNKQYVLLSGGHHNDLRNFGLFEKIGSFVSGSK